MQIKRFRVKGSQRICEREYHLKSVHHQLAQKDRLTVQDLYGEKMMLMRRGWSHYVDLLRDDLWKNHPQIQIVEFSSTMPNPTYAKVQEGAKLARENHVDMVLAVGGGSTFDLFDFSLNQDEMEQISR